MQQMGNGSDPLTAYDANGNIKIMQQWGHKLGGSVQIDNLAYTYPFAGNKLQKVEDANSDPQTKLGDFHDGNSGTNDDYLYDANGNMIADNNKAISDIQYNHLNLPMLITITGKGTIEYQYDAAGTKLKKIVNDNATNIQTTTLYLGNGIYKNDTLQFISHEEGRIRVAGSPAGFVYDYMLKDHLGNVRSVITEEQRTDMYPAATMELSQSTIENTFYANIDQTRDLLIQSDGYTNPNEYAARLRGYDEDKFMIGPAIALKVMAGDKFNVLVSSYWKTSNDPGNTISPLDPLLNTLNSTIGNIQGGHATQTELETSNVLLSAATDFLSSQTYNTSYAKAYLNWILLDERFNYVSAGSGFDQVEAMNTIKVHSFTDVEITKSGYLFVYVSNASKDVDVYFDNLQVTHIRGPLVEESHYYPFGLTLNGISSRALNFGNENKVLFNGYEHQRTEFSDLSGLEWYDYKNRFYDNQIGRFFVQDKLATDYVYYSPYQFAGNEVPNAIDLDGLEPWRPNVFSGNLKATEYKSVDNTYIKFQPVVKGSSILKSSNSTGGIYMTNGKLGEGEYGKGRTGEFREGEGDPLNVALLIAAFAASKTALDYTSVTNQLDMLKETSLILIDYREGTDGKIATDNLNSSTQDVNVDQNEKSYNNLKKSPKSYDQSNSKNTKGITKYPPGTIVYGDAGNGRVLDDSISREIAPNTTATDTVPWRRKNRNLE